MLGFRVIMAAFKPPFLMVFDMVLYIGHTRQRRIDMLLLCCGMIQPFFIPSLILE